MVDSGEETCSLRLRKVVTMAAPLLGLPAARALWPLLPCCRDILSGCDTLQRAHRAHRLLAGCLVAGGDFLVPPANQFLEGMDKIVMEGFQHMDFIVGNSEQIERTAREVIRCLRNSH
jgi:hypothetical protein